ncbi:MAG: TetR/AcrR family transcriptional regulator, partial [Oscillospiraceae bacterium]|nr:TetR/AcrR family transcriptional regulator [Oscillospiraceae bacterium]
MGEQIILGKGGTREKIFLAAVRLFSAQTYGCVTMRDIAAQAGIKVASIYNHFASKQELLQAMYDFYAHQQRMAAPNLQKMLALAETAPPREVLMMADFHYPPAVQETMDRILIIAAIEARGSAKSQRFVKEHILDLTN